MSLWLCLRFEQLPLQCLNRLEEHPVVVLARQRVVRRNDCAASLGINEGMGAATVRALAGSSALRLLERDPVAEQHALQQLCCWAYSITPTLYTFRTDCLQLEIGGCLKLFNGLDALLQQVASDIRSRGYQYHPGLADTPGAAWLLSYTDPDAALAVGIANTVRLAPLSLQLLDGFSSTVASLRRAGLHTLGDILALPGAALGRRCGQDFTHFMQQVLGQREDLHPDYQPPTVFSDAYWFGYEVKANAELLPAIQLLLQSLCRFLRNTQLQTGEILWQLIDIDGTLIDIVVRSTNNHSDWHNWYQLTCIRIDQLRLTQSVESINLQCNKLQGGELASMDFFSPRSQREPMAGLLDRLRNRLGLQAIEQVSCRDEHLPELALHIGNDKPVASDGATQLHRQRPFWLMPKPQQLRLQGHHLYWHGRLALVYGPERIEDNWWLEPTCRDYFIASDPGGQHYWVFNDRLSKNWYIHGIFA